MAYTRIWAATEPQGFELASDLDLFIQNHKRDETERFETEHFFNATGSDDTAFDADMRHKPGFVGVLFEGTTAEIDAITTGGDGGTAIDTETGQYKRFNIGTGLWVPTDIGGGVGSGPDLGVSGITPTGNFGGEDLTNAFDGNIATFTDELPFTPGDTNLTWDLGGIKNGWIFVILDIKVTSSPGRTGFTIRTGYDSALPIENDISGDQTHLITSDNTSFDIKKSLLVPFIAQFFAISLTSGTAGTIRIRHLAVTGTPFTLS